MNKTPQRREDGQFQVGHTGMGGRPKGSRNLLGEAMLADLYADWLEHGIATVRQVREERPSDYLKVVALLVALDDAASADGGVTVVNVITGVRG